MIKVKKSEEFLALDSGLEDIRRDVYDLEEPHKFPRITVETAIGKYFNLESIYGKET